MREVCPPASMAGRLCLSPLRADRGTLDDVRWIITVSELSWADIPDGWYRVPGYTQAVADVVSRDVVRNRPEERRQRPGLAAGAGTGKLRDSLDLAPQAASGDGSAWPGSPRRECRSR